MACEAECRAFLTIQAGFAYIYIYIYVYIYYIYIYIYYIYIYIYILRKPAGKLASCCLRTK